MIFKTIKEFPITSLTVLATLVLPFLLRPEVPTVVENEKASRVHESPLESDNEKYWDDDKKKVLKNSPEVSRRPSSVKQNIDDNSRDLAAEQSENYEPVSEIGNANYEASSSSSDSQAISGSSYSSSPSSFSNESFSNDTSPTTSTPNPSEVASDNNGVTSSDDIKAVAGCGSNCNQTISSTTVEDTTTSSSGDDSTSSLGGGNIPSVNNDVFDPKVLANKSSGTYSQAPTITLTGTDVSTIQYCIGTGGSCCDPTSGSVYSSAFSIASTDGNYCLSIIGQATDGSFSDKVDYTYTVNSQTPDLSVATNVQYLQTTELFTMSINSTDFGESDHVMRFYNLSADPIGKTCSEISTENDHTTLGLDVDNDGNSDQYDLASLSGTYVLSDIKRELNYGTNYIISLIENNSFDDDSLYSCATDTIILSDFDYLMDFNISTGSVPVNGNGHMEFQGHFNSYGHFGAGVSGSGVDTTHATAYLESGAINILN